MKKDNTETIFDQKSIILHQNIPWHLPKIHL